MDWTRARREAKRRLTDARGRLTAAERELADARARLRLAERGFGVADGRVTKAEQALDAARTQRDQARRERYAARQAYGRASLTVDRLQRRIREVSDHLDRMPPLAPTQSRLGGGLARDRSPRKVISCFRWVSSGTGRPGSGLMGDRKHTSDARELAVGARAPRRPAAPALPLAR
jgi:hypothetical protein